MKDYYNGVSGIGLDELPDVITQIWGLTELTEGVNGVNTSGLTRFADSMRKMGDAGISGFTDAFYNRGGVVNSAVVSILTSVRGPITSNVLVAGSAMKILVEPMAGVAGKRVVATEDAADDMMRNLIVSIPSSPDAVKMATETVASAAISQTDSMKSEFKITGENAGRGFTRGVHFKFSASSSMGRGPDLAVLNAVKKTLDSYSPSRELTYLGESIGEDLAISIDNSIVSVAQAVSNMIGEVTAVGNKDIDVWKDWVDEKTYYDELSLEDRLTGWKNLQKRYRAGPEERKQVSREVY